MPQGIQVWDATGTLIFDTTTITARLIGYQTITNSSGNITNSQFSTGTPFYLFMPGSYTTTTSPQVVFSGTNMSWPAGTFSGIIYYGVR